MRNFSAAMLTFCALAALSISAGGSRAWAQDPAPDPGVAPASAIQITLPFNKAIVRESVPIKVREFPDGGYVSISIDDRFVTAQALPRKQTDPVYVWDTKASYTTPDAPNDPKTYSDGTHALTISVFDPQNKLVGKDSVSVQLANKINLPASQGITLAYPWKTSLNLLYQRRTELTAAPTDSTDPEQIIQQSLLRYRRTVENTTGGTYLIRDEALPVVKSGATAPFVSSVTTRSATMPLQNGYDIRARYREVDTRGHVLSEVGVQNGGLQLGFSIPVLPPRRVSVGAHWESPVQMTLDWTSPYPTTVTATSTLEDFEWQDRYPTAKIRETYTGPASFNPGPGSPLPLIQSQDIKFERVIYFAYNAGRVVRMETTLTLTSTAPGLLVNTATSGAGQYPGNPMSPDGGQYPGNPNGRPGSYPGNPMSPENPMSPSNYPGGNSRRRRNGNPMSPSNYPGNPMSPGAGQYPGALNGMPGNYPGNPNYPGQGGATGVESVPVKLKYTETSVILI